MSMSDTPRTDAFKNTLPSGIDSLNVAVWVANQYLKFARELERELNSAYNDDRGVL